MFSYLRRLPIVGGVLAIAALASLLLAAAAGADNTAGSWLSPSNLNLQKESVVTTLPSSINGNIDCFKEDIFSCVVATPYGLASTTGSLKLNGTQSYAPIYSYIDGQQHFLAIPNSNKAITYTTEPVYGLYLYFNNFAGSVTALAPFNALRYQINKPPEAILTDKDGHRLAADYGSISFSANGQWMVVSMPNIAMLRVNLQTFEVAPFAAGYNYTLGLAPNPQTAISNDGRYAIVGSKDFGAFAIYDLNTCASTPSTITGTIACQSRSLQSFVANQVDGFVSASNFRFISDDSFSFYGTYASGGTSQTAKFILTNSPGVAHQLDYLALGDSYISGEGAFNYQPGTDTSSNTCHLSLFSYPYLLGYALNINSYHTVACSGAVTEDIVDRSNFYSGQVKDGQSKNKNDVPSILANFKPGYIDQLDFVSTYQPQAITVSVGGNDIGFTSKLKDCVGFGTCYGSYEDRLEFVREVNSAFTTLVNTYSQIKNTGAPDARIYVIGYPQIAKTDGDCGLNVHMNHEELIFAQQAIGYLDSVIQAAAARAGVMYVDTQTALNGHRLCEAGPGQAAVNGITAGNDTPSFLHGPIGRESYHPNALGHQLLEQAVLAGTDQLTQNNPAPDFAAAPPPETELEILNAPHTGRPVNIAEYDQSISSDMMLKQTINNISVDGAQHSLPPSTTLQANLHSDPINLGDFVTDSEGNLNAQLAIPADTPTGYHTLHFYGNDLNGQAIDIYKVIYVAESPTDIDGNGIPDSTQACVGVTPSGQDMDKDGIDDSCDAQIGVAPQTIQANSSTVTPMTAGTSSSGNSNPVVTQPKVLSASTTNQPANDASQVQLASATTTLPDPKFLASTGGLFMFTAACYAAWKFRG